MKPLGLFLFVRFLSYSCPLPVRDAGFFYAKIQVR